MTPLSVPVPLNGPIERDDLNVLLSRTCRPFDIRFDALRPPTGVARGDRGPMAEADADQTTEERATVPAWRLPGPDRDAIMAQRAGLIDEVRALEAMIAAKRRQINALGDLAGLPRRRGA